MSFLNNVRILPKVLSTLALLSLLALGMTGMSLLRLGESDARYSALLEEEAAAVKWIARTNTTLVDVGRVLNQLIAESDAARMRGLSAGIDNLAGQYRERAGKVASVLPSAADRMTALTREFDALMPIRAEIEKASLAAIMHEGRRA